MDSIDAGDGLRLDPVESADAPELFRLVDANRDHLHPWMPWVDATRTAQDTATFVAQSVAGAAERRSAVFVLREGDAVRGTIGVHGIQWLNRSAEIGYWLAAEATGRGLITRATAAVLDFLFDEYELHRVEIRCAPENRASRAVPERLGFTEEARVREAGCLNDGTYCDLVVYGLLDREWRARSARRG